MLSVNNARDSVILYEKTPAKIWEESFVLGNGTLGASVFGGTESERIALNHDTLWSGYPRNDIYRNDSLSSLEKAKALINEKRYAEAHNELSDNFSQYASQSYMPFGDLTLDFTYSENAGVKGYKRVLDMEKSTVTCSYTVGSARIERCAYVSHPDKLLVYKMESNGSKFSVTVGVSSQLYSRTYAEGTRLITEVECPVTSEQNLFRTDRTTVYSDKPEERGIRAMGIASVITNGSVKNLGNHIKAEGATYIEIRYVIETSFNGWKKHPFLEGKPYAENCKKAADDAVKKEEKVLYARHLKDVRRYFSRLALNVGTSRRGRIPTSVRLADYQNGKEDKALPVLLFNFGRYLTLASSRAGSQATNLQGIWNVHFFAPWHSNYTININTEMNYFPTLMIGMKEMYKPLIDLVCELSEGGKATARTLYGADGWVSHHNTDLWRHSQPVAGDAVYLFWNASTAWLSQHLFEYYEYTLDKKYLEKKAYPVMREAARFFLSQLASAPDGTRIVFPSTSPENYYCTENGKSAVSETTEMTMACVRELFKNLEKAAEILEISDDVTEAVKTELPLLRKPQIGSDGRLLEWYNELPESEVNHRHVSHLYGLHPGSEISPLTTPELADACRKTLEVRGDEGTGWSLAWKCNFFARLHDGDHAFSLLKQQLRPCLTRETVMAKGGGSYPNLLCAHPPFQIDGNFGATSGVAEMLLQSTADTVHIIPALPTEWSDLSVRGLRAKGNRRVEFTVSDGKVVSCSIFGKAPEKVFIAGRDVTDKLLKSDGHTGCTNLSFNK